MPNSRVSLPREVAILYSVLRKDAGATVQGREREGGTGERLPSDGAGAVCRYFPEKFRKSRCR